MLLLLWRELVTLQEKRLGVAICAQEQRDLTLTCWCCCWACCCSNECWACACACCRCWGKLTGLAMGPDRIAWYWAGVIWFIPFGIPPPGITPLYCCAIKAWRAACCCRCCWIICCCCNCWSWGLFATFATKFRRPCQHSARQISRISKTIYKRSPNHE